jgi:hypothetical protein
MQKIFLKNIHFIPIDFFEQYAIKKQTDATL